MDDGANFAERPQLVARIETVPLSGVPESVRRGEVRLVVHSRAGGLPPAPYLQAAAGTPPGRDVVAAVSLGTVNAPDEVQVEEVRRDERRLFLRVQIRTFAGRLAANVQRLALVIVDLGDLAPGSYDAEVRIDRYVFTTYEHPETATFDRSSSHHLQFDIAGA